MKRPTHTHGGERRRARLLSRKAGSLVNTLVGIRTWSVVALLQLALGCTGRPLTNRSTHAVPDVRMAKNGQGYKAPAQHSPAAPPPFELVPQLGHGLGVSGISISPNGKVAATASADNSVRIWDAETGIMLRQLPIGEQVHDVAILHDGQRAVVVAGYDVQLWDLLRGARLAKFKTEGSAAMRARLLNQPDWVVFGDAGGGIELWDLGRLQRVRHLFPEVGEMNIVWGLDVSADDRSVAAAFSDGTIKIIDLQSGLLEREWAAHSHAARGVRFSRDGGTLTSFGDDKTIRQWNAKTGVRLNSQSFGEAINAAALLTDQSALIGFYQGNPKIVDLNTGGVIRDLQPWPGVSAEGVAAVAVSPDGRRSVTGGHGGSVLFSNLDDGTPIHATAGRRSGIMALALSPSGGELAAAYYGGEVDIWDVASGARLRQIPDVHDDHCSCYVAYTRDGRRLLRSVRENLYVWDARNGELLQTIKAAGPLDQRALAVSPNGQLAATAGGMIAVYAIDSGRLLWTGPRNQNLIGLAFTPDSARLVAGTNGHGITIHDATSGAELRRFNGPAADLDGIEFSDANTALLRGSNGLSLWNLQSGQSQGKPLKLPGVGKWALSADRNWVIASHGGQMVLLNVHTGEWRRQFASHIEEIRSIVPSRDGKLVYTASFDGTIRVIPFETLLAAEPNEDFRPLVWLGDRNEWLAYSTDGYFDASRRGGGLVATVSGLDGFRVDQLAVRNNRPDITLGRVGLGTQESLSVFASRHQQRLRRLGFSESELADNLMSAPQANITEFSRAGRRAHLKCVFSGRGRQLKRYYVFVNDVVVGDGEGTPLAGADVTVDLDVDLSSGRNKLEVSALNDVGVESLRDVRTANVAEPVRGNLYYLGFGVSRYADPRLTLRYADKDALDLGSSLMKMEGRGFDRVFVHTLTNSQVTKSSIAKAREFLARASVDDIAVVFVAGHGIFRDGPDEQYYFATYDTDIARIHETAAGYGLIESIMTGIVPRKKLLLLDTCQSGERDGEQEETRVNAGNSRGLVARGIRIQVLESGVSGVHGPRFTAHQDRFIFNDLSRRSGTIVFSAAHGFELSYEDDRLRNGTFTFELVRALTQPGADVNHDGWLSTDELRNYVTQAVSNRTHGLQNPTVDRDNLEALFGFPILERAAKRPK